jgi:hypothetical protein
MTCLVTSQAYRDLWGDRFGMTKLEEGRIENNQTGFKLASSTGGVGTGERGDRVILDDPHNVVKMESQIEREKTIRFFRESMSNRLNDDNSAISNIAYAGQYQQSPVPRKGGIIKREYWMEYLPTREGKFPDMASSRA